jgi:hypothetical protein
MDLDELEQGVESPEERALDSLLEQQPEPEEEHKLTWVQAQTEPMEEPQRELLEVIYQDGPSGRADWIHLAHVWELNWICQGCLSNRYARKNPHPR